MPLPFPRLPKLCQLDIIEKLDFPELVRLSTCSQKTVELIQQSTIPGKIQLESVKVENADVILLFRVGSDNERRYWIGINQGIDVQEQLKWNGLDGMQFSERFIQEEHFSGWYCAAFLSSLTMTDQLISHLRSFIRNFKPKALAVFPTNCMSKRLIEEHFPKLGALIIDSEHGEELASEHMKWAMDTVEVTDELLVTCEIAKTRNEFKYTEGFKAKKVFIRNPNWIHLNAIIDSQTEVFEFFFLPPTSQFLNTILKAWISNEKLQNLKQLSFETLNPRFAEFFQNQVMEGIQETELTPKEQQQFEEDQRNEFVRFIRRIDGKVGVAMVQQGRKIYKFLVL